MSGTTWTSIITSGSDTIDHDAVDTGDTSTPVTPSPGGATFNGIMGDSSPIFFGNDNDYSISFNNNTSLEFDVLSSTPTNTDIVFKFTDSSSGTDDDLFKIHKGGAIGLKDISQAEFDSMSNSSQFGKGTIVSVNGQLQIKES